MRDAVSSRNPPFLHPQRQLLLRADRPMAGATLVVGPFGSSTHREAGASRSGARMPNAAPAALGFRLPRANREKGRGKKFA